VTPSDDPSWTSFVDQDRRIPATVRQRLADVEANEVQNLAANLAKGIEDYRFRTGKIAGIRAAIALCEEIEKLIGG
jgi:hypothetical protein